MVHVSLNDDMNDEENPHLDDEPEIVDHSLNESHRTAFVLGLNVDLDDAVQMVVSRPLHRRGGSGSVLFFLVSSRCHSHRR